MNEAAELRFDFGRNWTSFAKLLDETRIAEAIQSLQGMLGVSSLHGKRFLDIGCGSGLFSLAAQKLGAEVVSFDYDSDSVRCAEYVRANFGCEKNWLILRGDVLNRDWLASLGQFDIVYSWGVLHHTGAMWQALENINVSVIPGGLVFISIYNDQGIISQIWRGIKAIYNKAPRPLKLVMASAWFCVVLANRVVFGLRERCPIRQWFVGSPRGMSLWHDTVDWVGGYPFETATPEALVAFFESHGYAAVSLQRKTGSGCNELVLRRRACPT